VVIQDIEIRKRSELAPATIQELQKRLAMLLVTKEETEVSDEVSPLPPNIHQSFDLPSTHSTEDLPMEVFDGRKRSPQVKDLMRPRAADKAFPTVRRRPSLRKTDASRYSRFGIVPGLQGLGVK
jgi:hypothetical protein